MIELSRISKTILPKPPVMEKAKTVSKKTIEHNVNLKLMPQYPALSYVNVKSSAIKAIYDFKKEFGEVKSATYVGEKYKQAKRNGASEEVLDALYDKRSCFSGKIKQMRKNIYSVNYACYDDYIKSLKKYIKENGSYMNCNECADLMLDKLRRRGVDATNVAIYTLNKEGQRTSGVEHVFTVAGLREGADITKPETWGSNAVICDAWAGICEKAQDGIKFYGDFFNAGKGNTHFGFEFCNRNYGINIPE